MKDSRHGSSKLKNGAGKGLSSVEQRCSENPMWSKPSASTAWAKAIMAPGSAKYGRSTPTRTASAQAGSGTIRPSMAPIFSISMRQTSPAFIQPGGVIAAATPDEVPVATTSPGSSV